MEERLHNLMMVLEGKSRIESVQTDEMYILNNTFYPDLPEYNKSCPACRERIYNRLKNLWELNIKNKFIK
jgi:hypothetical protein